MNKRELNEQNNLEKKPKRMLEAETVLEVIRSRRSVRFFENDPISDEQLMMILESGRWAPSAVNAQPWEFVVIKDPKVKTDLMDTMTRVGLEVKKKFPEFPWKERIIRRDSKLISNVPVLITVCADLDNKKIKKYSKLSRQHSTELVILSVAAAIQNMLIMARALGLGSLWISPTFSEEIKKLLCIPQRFWLSALIPIGYPTKQYDEGACREPLDMMTHYNRYRGK